MGSAAGNSAMSDTKGRTPQDRRTVDLSEEPERRDVIDSYFEVHPGFAPATAEKTLDESTHRLAPSGGRSALHAEMAKVIGRTAY
jgi:hypothetical protein